jgi:hypothetical protein
MKIDLRNSYSFIPSNVLYANSGLIDNKTLHVFIYEKIRDFIKTPRCNRVVIPKNQDFGEQNKFFPCGLSIKRKYLPLTNKSKITQSNDTYSILSYNGTFVVSVLVNIVICRTNNVTTIMNIPKISV